MPNHPKAATLNGDSGNQITNPYRGCHTESTTQIRGKSLCKSSFGGSHTNGDTNLVLVEIVSALNVPCVHNQDPDPYVTVSFLTRGGEDEEKHVQEVHRTSVLKGTPYPVWTVQNGSLFLLPIPTMEDGGAEPRVSFVLKEYDTMLVDATLGTLEMPLQRML